MQRIVLVEDHKMFRDALARVLGREPDFEVVGRAASLAEAHHLCTSAPFDVAVVDLNLPDGDGTDVIGELKAANPGSSVLVLTVVPDHARHAGAIGAGAVGILAKDASIREIVGAIRLLGSGRQGPLSAVR